MNVEIWLALLGTAILISLSPGASAATAMGAGLTYGIRGAGWNTLGLVCGYGVQILVVCFSLGKLLATAPEWFTILKWVGVAYLTWLGLQFWRRCKSADIESHAFAPPHKRFLQALMVNMTNPKGLMFLLALIPQFIDPIHPQWLQLLIISATLMASEACIMTGYSGLASGLRRRFADPAALMWQQRLTGSALIAAALVLSATTL
ncbi:LysE family transporter [Marinobacterium marinum]|uniref:LysE family transporter n=1 Tax=Marinobacterium marinum TaxID=2756129 RepID=A0A7W1WWB3_9GAMM|nr:LysE family transporter [Marinobacterium marinum]MBA4501394.1 LysE family transporter [Marinobacterium marinum]